MWHVSRVFICCVISAGLHHVLLLIASTPSSPCFSIKRPDSFLCPYYMIYYSFVLLSWGQIPSEHWNNPDRVKNTVHAATWPMMTSLFQLLHFHFRQEGLPPQSTATRPACLVDPGQSLRSLECLRVYCNTNSCQSRNVKLAWTTLNHWRDLPAWFKVCTFHPTLAEESPYGLNLFATLRSNTCAY